MSTADGPQSAAEPDEEPHSLQAQASDAARVYQAGRDQFIADRDVHLHYWDRDRSAHRADGAVVEVCPYPGLAAFGPEYADWFFGRKRLIAELTGRLADSLTGRTPLVVVAPSGAGKSSLLQAGLLPAIERGALPAEGSRGWPRVLFTPTSHPMKALTSHLAELTGDDPAQASLWVTDRDVCRVKLSRASRENTGGSGWRVLVVVDQVEEIFTLCEDDKERLAFIDMLAWLADPGEGNDPVGLVVLGLRADYYARCADFPWLRTAVQDSQLFLGPMSRGELREAVIFPARAVGLDVEPGLVDVLLRDLGVGGGLSESAQGASAYEAGRLPLLAHALRSTWQQRHGHLLTVDGYQATGGIEHAVATTAERVFAGLEPAGRQVARKHFLRMVTVGAGAEDSRRRVLRADLMRTEEDPQATRTFLDAFTGARLLTQERDTVAISHEALLRAWPRLHGWINDDRAGNVVRQELHDAALAWDRAGRDSDALYRGNRLETALAAAGRDDVDQITRAFLAAATRLGKRAARIRLVVTAVLTALVLVASATAVLAFQQRGSALSSRRTALAERDSAVFNQIVAEADAARTTQTSLAAALDLSARRLRPTSDLYTHLITDADTALSAPLTGHTGIVTSAVYSPDGRTLATAGADRTVRLWTVTDPWRPQPLARPLTGHTAAVNAVAFSPDGRTLATASDDGTVRLWDVTAPSRPTAVGKPLTGHTDQVNSVAFSPDGRTLATAGVDGTVRLWQVADPAHPQALGRITVNEAGVYQAVFSPDGRTLATAGNDALVRLWDITDPTRPAAASAPMAGHTAAVWSVAFSPDGTILASAGYDDTIRLWNVTDPASPLALGEPLTDHTDGIWSVRFSPDGTTLASAGYDRTARLWTLPDTLPAARVPLSVTAFSPDRRTVVTAGGNGLLQLWNLSGPGRPVPWGPPLPGFSGTLRSVAFGRRGDLLAAAGDDGSIRLWRVGDPAHPKPLGGPVTGARAEITAIAFSPDGRTLASGGTDRMVRLWDITDPARPTALSTPLTGHRDWVTSLAFSPNGTTLASGADDDTVRLWNLADRRHPQPLGALLTAGQEQVTAIAFSPNGRTLASGGTDRTVRLWNLTDPARPTALSTPLTGHRDWVTSLAFSPNGTTLASGSRDRTVRLWDTADPGRPAPVGQPLTGHSDAVTSIAFSPDGHTLASASWDTTVRLWELRADQDTTRICAAIGPGFTAPLWKRYVAGLPFHPPCP